MSEAQKQDSPEVVEIKARHRQELARIETGHERDMALMDAESLRRMPLPLRMIFDDRLRDKIERAATDMSESVGFVPKPLVGKTAACKVVITKALLWNLDPFAVALSTYQTPDGKVAFEGKLYRAIAESSGILRGAIRHEYYGDWERLPRPSFRMVEKRSRDGNTYQVPEPLWEYWGEIEHGLGVTIIGTLVESGEEMRLNFDLVDAFPRNATTWPTRPKLQILNPAIRAFVNQVRPSLIMGVHFHDAPNDLPEMRDVTPADRETAQRTMFAGQVRPANGGGVSRAGPPTPRQPAQERRQATQDDDDARSHQGDGVPAGEAPGGARRVRYSFPGASREHGQIRAAALEEIRVALSGLVGEEQILEWRAACKPPLDEWSAQDEVQDLIDERIAQLMVDGDALTEEIDEHDAAREPEPEQPADDDTYTLARLGNSIPDQVGLTALGLVAMMETNIGLARDHGMLDDWLDRNAAALEQIAERHPELAGRVTRIMGAK